MLQLDLYHFRAEKGQSGSNVEQRTLQRGSETDSYTGSETGSYTGSETDATFRGKVLKC